MVREATLDLDMSWSPLFSVFALRFALAANDLAGYVITIEETARKRKMPVGF